MASGDASSSPTISDHAVEAARQQIVAFLKIEAFEDWHPSQQVRIKLVAPHFPRRVLKTVKWLGGSGETRNRAPRAGS
jgi:hypothetical protein